MGWIASVKNRIEQRKQRKLEEAERARLVRERLLERCRNGDHDWEVEQETQGGNDPNVEEYILIERSTCRVCGLRDVTISPCDDSDDDD